MNVVDLASARAALAGRLELVLPGRVRPQPPTTGNYVAPSLVIEQPAMVGPLVTFPIWAIVDGTIASQIAMLDELVWNVRLAVAPLVDVDISVTAQTLAGYRVAVVSAGLVIAVPTLCGLPEPAAVPIPATR